MTARKTIRCAIYTRKSTDEGLDQEFNTLEAQREACAAYARSQTHEGWKVLPERFDDGGHSGGTLERPAMQRLLERVRTRQVDVILIYKIDRLTRSLTDFAKLAELFDQHGVSFAAVTQQFSTTTSMGRLMLNVLLSFAQFEREIAGERIRDKIAASKKKGMWMGGSVPLGYDWKDRRLVINPAEAKTVRNIFDLYRQHGNVRAVVAEAARLKLRTKVRLASTSRRSGGNPFRRGHVYAMLQNPIYVGRIAHRAESFPADHPAIIDDKLWQDVQQIIAQNRTGTRKTTKAADGPSLLQGILFDAEGNRFTPSHTVKNGRRYRYYIEQALTTGEQPARSRLRRIPANEIKGVVQEGLADFLASPARLLQALGNGLDARTADATVKRGKRLAEEFRTASHTRWTAQARALLCRVTLSEDKTEVRVATDTLRILLELPDEASSRRAIKRDEDAQQYAFTIPTRVGVRGQQIKFVIGDEGDWTRQTDPSLIRVLAQAHNWFEQLLEGRVQSINEIARRERKASSYIGRVLRLAFLAPDIQRSILQGQTRPEVTAKRLILREMLSHEWAEQRRRLHL